MASAFRAFTHCDNSVPATALHVSVHQGYSALPEDCAGLFDDPAAGDFLRSREWLGLVGQLGLQAGDRQWVYAVADREGGKTVALLPAVYSRLFSAHPGARVLHFTFPEDQAFEPLSGESPALRGGAAAAVLDALRAAPPSYDVIRISPLLPGTQLAADLVAALRRTGHVFQVYRHGPARFENVAGMTSADYLSSRPRPLRESLERNTRLLLEGGRGKFHFPVHPVLLKATWGDVERVISSAPFEGEADPPGYVANLTALAAGQGVLRLGMFYLDGTPVAMQLWIATAGRARCLRIWGAQDQRTFPIDDVLTQFMAVCLIDGDKVTQLDFGNISDEFARDWAPQARERIGIAAFTPRTWRGLRGALRHVWARRLVSVPRRAWARVVRTAGR